MTFEKASNVYYISAKIKAVKEQLKDMEDERTFLQAVKYTGMPKADAGLSDKLEKYLDKRMALEKELTRLLDELNAARIQALDFINTIEDLETQDIVMMRCVNNMTWTEIGAEMHMDRRTASRKFYQFWNNQN